MTTGGQLENLPSVTELTTNESSPDLGTIAFPVLDRLPSAIHNNKIAHLKVLLSSVSSTTRSVLRYIQKARRGLGKKGAADVFS